MRGVHRWLALSLVLCACTDEKQAPRVPVVHLGADDCAGKPNGVMCVGSAALTCADGGVASTEECAEAGLSCDPTRGCVACKPYHYECQGNQVYLCERDGRTRTFVEDCGKEHLSCSPQGCADLCTEAEAKRSYLGCDYWPVFTSNSNLDPLFSPAVVVANPNLVPAQVTITQGDAAPIIETVEPHGAKSIVLEFDPRLQGRTGLGSELVRGGAYHLASSVPVTVHQFNPLLFEIGKDCIGPELVPDDKKCNSYTNDASLLLPSHVLSRKAGDGVSYVAVARASFLEESKELGWRGLPGFVAIVGVGPKPVHVTVRATARTVASAEQSQANEPVVPALEPGDTFDTMLAPGDVLQLRSVVPEGCSTTPRDTMLGPACDPGRDYDLTGTEISADGPVEVVSGHDCTNVPFDRVACDHLEESMFPVETWGKRVIVTRPRFSVSARYLLRVVSAADDNTVKFEPEIAMPVKLARGELFEVETYEHVIVTGTKPIEVAQFLEGQNASKLAGDPSMSLAIPVDQYRSSYNFLSPETYTVNYVNVVAQADDVVRLDGELVTSWEPVADGPYQVATVQLERAGEHEVTSENNAPLGLVLYGYAAYTSYMLPGGLDLQILGTVTQ